jgi:uncharacterized protein (TIGR02246 family)
MKSCLPIATLISVALLATACGPAAEQPVSEAPSQAEDVAALKAMVPEIEAAWNAGDAAALANLRTDDAIRMNPNEVALVGSQAIQSWHQTIFDQFTPKSALSIEEVEVAGDWAFVRGSYAITLTPKDGGEPTEDSGKFLVIEKRQPDGYWKCYRIFSNSDQPLPGAGE